MLGRKSLIDVRGSSQLPAQSQITMQKLDVLMEADMANPHRPGTTGTTSTTGTPPTPPEDPEEFREIQLLAEAGLVSFTATPNPLKPFGHATLAWDVTMPTTVIPGVHVEVHLYGVGNQLVDRKGRQVVAPYGDTSYTLLLRTPLASRQLGTLDLAVDFGSCRSISTASIIVEAIVKLEAEKPFPAGGQVTLRRNGSSVDIGFNSFVVDIPLTASVPNWFDPDVDVSLGFNVFAQDGHVRVTYATVKTNVSFGTASSILSAGCSAAVAAALEAQSDGFLSQFIGPEVAKKMESELTAKVNETLDGLNHSVPPPPVPYRLYDITLTVEGLSYRFCPVHPAPLGPTHPPGGGSHPVHA
jgi:hypothetical protein